MAIQNDGKIVLGSSGIYEGFTAFKIKRLLPDGMPDSAFGTNGLVFILFPDFKDPETDGGSVSAITVLTDGKILATGNLGGNVSGGIGLTRLMPDGSVDETFGNQGYSEVNPTGDYLFVNALAVQADGKILVGGREWVTVSQNIYKFCTLRCLANGSLDINYGKKGEVRSISDGEVRTISIQPDGKIVAGGNSGYTNFLSGNFSARFRMERYNEDGSYDNTFGANGIVSNQVIITNTVSVINNISLQPAGKIVAVGRSNGGFDTYFTVVRYNRDGSFDNSFGKGGIVTTFTSGAEAKAVMIGGEKKDKIIAAGMTNNDFALAAYQADGTLDAGFGKDGTQTTDIKGTDYLSTAALQPDGKIFLSGYSVDASFNYSSALSRYYGYPQKVSLFVKLKRWLQNHTLSWKGLPAEDKIAYYAVEQSANGASGFTQVAKVSGVSNLKDYTITNSHLLQGNNYYRIKAVSSDGVIKYSEVVSADNTANTANVYPNPAKNYVTVQGLAVNETANISIKDGSGNVLAKGVSSGSEQYRSPLGSNMKPGTYYLNITTGSKTEVLKFVKE